MVINFYKVSDSPNKINKTLGTALTVTGYVREDTIDQYEPEVLVDADVTGYNYMYIATWGKYYFINGCENPRNGVYRVKDVHVDVLMTYKTSILAQRVIIDKTEATTLKNEYIDDGSIVLTNKINESKYEFDNGFNNDGSYSYVLIAAGKPGPASS